MRPTAEKRHNDFTKAIRKRNLDRALSPGVYHHDWYDNLHQYSVNKIHCSCPLCSAKTGRDGRTIRDQRRYDEMDYEEEEEFDLD